MIRFWRALAQDADEGTPNYDWLVEQIADEDHPRYGPPIPMDVLSRVLLDAYEPAMTRLLNAERPFLEWLRRDRVGRL